MKKLLKEYNFKYNEDYFYMISDSYINGQIVQAGNQIKNMPKNGKKEFILFLFFSSSLDNNFQEWAIKEVIKVI